MELSTSLSNIRHSKEASHQIQKFILQSHYKLIKQIEKQIQEIKLEIEKLICSDPEIKQKVGNIMTTTGVGLITVATIIAEPLGF